MTRAFSIILLAFLFCVSTCLAKTQDEKGWSEQRQNLTSLLKEKGIKDAKVLSAINSIPRHFFVPDNIKESSYADTALPIGLDQTISQPYIVAFMTEALKLKKSDKVLEIGTGSGYQAAILSKLVDKVYTIEILEPLTQRAKRTLQKVGIKNVIYRTGNGYLGWPQEAPFDAIIVTAAPEEIPKKLLDQLKEGGRMLIPVGKSGPQGQGQGQGQGQDLLRLTKENKQIKRENLLPVIFVPLVDKK